MKSARTSAALTFLLFSGLALSPSAASTSPLKEPKDHAVAKMRTEGFSESFIQLVLKTYDESTREKIVALNILGFVAKADYSAHMSPRAVKNCLDFKKKNRHTLVKAEKLYGVDPDVITSLLWVETKHGKLIGRYPVASVYFSLIQADHPEVIESSLKALSLKVDEVTSEHTLKVNERSQKKALWALGELKSLEGMHKSRAQDARKLRGSFAGAFGIPQFIPSSYAQWAKPSRGPAASPNLFRSEDAILSVAHYLKSNGWVASNPKSYQEALFHYNRSQGYVDVILKLARCVQSGDSGCKQAP